MRKKKIGVDVDGVLRDIHRRLIEVYLKYYPKHKVGPIEQWHTYDISPYFPIGRGLYKFWFEDHPDEIYLQSKPYRGAVKFIQSLRQNNEVVIVTKQPSEHTKKLTEEWLIINNIENHGILHAQDKGIFEGDMLLDDSTKNLEDILETKSAIPVCFNQPWNRDWKGLRVYNYHEFLDIIKNHHSI